LVRSLELSSLAQTQHFGAGDRPTAEAFPLSRGRLDAPVRLIVAVVVTVVAVLIVVVSVSGPELPGAAAHLLCMESQNQVAGPVVERLIGIGELSALIGVPVATIYDWRTRGLGPVAHRFGKHLRFTVSEVAAWIATQRETGPVAPASAPRLAGIDAGAVR
jgi:predicted DNA-binding transcriptional regulator AlpA